MKFSRAIFFLVLLITFMSANAGLTYIKDVIAQTVTDTPTPTTVPPTATPVPPTATSTPIPAATNTPTLIPTSTLTPTPTYTPTPTRTPTPTNTPTPTSTPTPTPTPTGAYSISGNVYIDANANKNKDTGEGNYASGAVVDLTGDVVKRLTTDSSGNYSFNHLYRGDYVVTLTIPGGHKISTPVSANIRFP